MKSTDDKYPADYSYLQEERFFPGGSGVWGEVTHAGPSQPEPMMIIQADI